MSAYDWIAANPELLPLYLALALALAGWVYASFRKLFEWGVSISAELSNRWSPNDPLPPDEATVEILLFAWVLAVNLALIGGYIYLVT